MAHYFDLPSGGRGLYLSREDWESPKPLTRGRALPESSFVGIVIHHLPGMGERLDEPDELPTSMALADALAVAGPFMRSLQVVRPDLGSEVPYSWVVLPGAGVLDVIVCEGRGAGRTGAHTAGFNSSRYGVGFARNTSDDALTVGMLEGANWVGATYVKVSNPVATVGHQHSYATECPGTDAMRHLPQLQPPYTAVAGAAVVPAAVKVGAPVGEADVIRPGDYGVGVELFQRRVNALLSVLGSSQRCIVTGVHDEQSVAWCEALQRWKGLEVDGIVGQVETWPALIGALAAAGEPWAVSGGNR